ncbi:hypothetical protein [Maribacter sp. 2307ULW6-5]|uniref:hypothetical protein n=1 Tax=Maribacter sp. 2307ULW6-5 TaxID=3386275 RepID=UPI0039BC5A71
MKKILKFLIFFTMCCTCLWGQTEGINYQAVLVDNNPNEIPGVDVPSNNIPNKAISVQFSIVDATGNLEYQETHATQTDDYGTINLVIGEGEPTGFGAENFEAIDWDGPKTLNVDIDLEAGSDFAVFSSQPLTYLPYVRHRNLVADGITDLNNGLNVNNQTPSLFTGDVLVEQNTRLQRLRVQGASEFQDRVVMDVRLSETNQSDIDAYPLLLQGSRHGMAIKLNSTVPTREHNFMSFWNANNEPIGRIEGFQALSDVSQNFILEVLLENEPTEEEAEEREDDDTAPPAAAPGAFDIYLNNDYSLNLLLEYMDLLEASVAFGANLGACIGGLAVLGDCDDVAWSAFGLFVQGAQISLTVAYNESNRGTAFESGGADYAEWLKKSDVDEKMAFGDVVGVRAGEISKRFTTADHFMVISQNPIVSGAMPQPGEEHKYKRVAFIGQVPVKVLGTVNKGDYILPSGNGDGMALAVAPGAMSVNDYQRIVGVAWEEYFGEELFSYINTAVGINQNDMVREMTEMQKVLNGMQAALAEVNPKYKPVYFDVEPLSVSNNKKTTTSKNVLQLALEKYGLDTAKEREAVLMEVSRLMTERDNQLEDFKFSKMPLLQEVLTNPTPENIEAYTQYYINALMRLRSVVTTRSN